MLIPVGQEVDQLNVIIPKKYLSLERAVVIGVWVNRLLLQSPAILAD